MTPSSDLKDTPILLDGGPPTMSRLMERPLFPPKCVMEALLPVTVAVAVPQRLGKAGVGIVPRP